MKFYGKSLFQFFSFIYDKLEKAILYIIFKKIYKINNDRY